MMKKLISILLSLTVLSSCLVLPGFAVNAEAAQTEESIREAYMQDPEFNKYLQADPEGAMAMLEHVLARQCSTESDIGLNSYDGNNYAWVDTTLVKQHLGYNCGPTSALMAIWGWGGTVDGDTVNDQQDTLGTAMGTNSSVGTAVYKVRDVLNEYAPSYKYNFYLGKTMTKLQFRTYVFSSLSHDRAPILHAKTGALTYYQGHDTGHYITVAGFDYDTMEMTLYDCHPTSTYYGIHQVPYYEAYKAINQIDGRYLIVNY